MIHKRKTNISLFSLPTLLVMLGLATGCGGGGGGGGSTVSGPAGGTSMAATTTQAGTTGSFSGGTSGAGSQNASTGSTTGSGSAGGSTGSSAGNTGSTSGTTGSTAGGSTAGTTGSSTGSTGNPFKGATMWVDPSSDAVNQCTTYDNSGDTADAQQVEKIATQPWAYWVSGGDNTLEPQDVSWISSTAAAGYLPVITAYSIPNRDLGGLAAGGSTSAANYQTWISSLAQAIGNNKAVVILEPDATADIPNMSSTDQATRYSLLQYAVSTLKAQPNVTVYIDAGNPNWVSAAEMAPILQSAGIAQADGFSINVSNFVDTPTCLSYGDTLSALVGGKHYVVDTSRNGQGAAPGGAWCNPPGRGLGWQPTADTADPLCDAYLWIKAPGYTDGSCNGGPSWGWWASYALGLCQNSIF